MANKFTRFLTGVVNGATNPKGQMANWRHATRIFVDNNYALAPRTKFMFFVQFNISNQAAGATSFNARHSGEVGLLVKSADLPKYNFDQVVKNQYNRKKILYKQINYDPVTITLHDDNTGVVNAMWALYYGTYIADRLAPTAAFTADHYRAASQDMDNYNYGMDNQYFAPFFNSISIYTMSRRRYNGYTLVNPRITNWSHGNVSYADGGTAESSMTLSYEAVQYSTGQVFQGSPDGFASGAYYDLVPSPLSVAGGGVSNLFGDGGVLAGMEQVFGDVSKGNIFAKKGGFLNTAIAAINTAKNLSNLTKEGLAQEFTNILSTPGGLDAAVNTVGGIVGTVFPKNAGTSPTNNDGVATPRVIAKAAFTGADVTAPPGQ
jgi:hypothetical protein